MWRDSGPLFDNPAVLTFLFPTENFSVIGGAGFRGADFCRKINDSNIVSNFLSMRRENNYFL